MDGRMYWVKIKILRIWILLMVGLIMVYMCKWILFVIVYIDEFLVIIVFEIGSVICYVMYWLVILFEFCDWV